MPKTTGQAGNQKQRRPAILIRDSDINSEFDRLAKAMNPPSDKTTLLKAVARAAIKRGGKGEPLIPE